MNDHRLFSNLVKIPICHHLTDIYPGWCGELKVCALDNGNYFIVYPDWRSKVSISLSSKDGKMISKSRLSDQFLNIKITTFNNKVILAVGSLIYVFDSDAKIIVKKEMSNKEDFRIQCLTATKENIYCVTNEKVTIRLLDWKLETIDRIKVSFHVDDRSYFYSQILVSNNYIWLFNFKSLMKLNKHGGQFLSSIQLVGFSDLIAPNDNNDYAEVFTLTYDCINKTTFIPSQIRILDTTTSFYKVVYTIFLDNFPAHLNHWFFDSKHNIHFVSLNEKSIYKMNLCQILQVF
jgi:hypothetical protein